MKKKGLIVLSISIFLVLLLGALSLLTACGGPSATTTPATTSPSKTPTASPTITSPAKTTTTTATPTKTATPTPTATTKYSVEELNYLTDKEILAVCKKYVNCGSVELMRVTSFSLSEEGYTWQRTFYVKNKGTIIGSGTLSAVDTTKYGSGGSTAGSLGIGDDGGRVITDAQSGDGLAQFHRGIYFVRVGVAKAAGGPQVAQELAKIVDDRMK